MQSLSKSFHTHLEARVADSGCLRRDAHHIRFKVYCDECGYEDPTRFPDQLETDEFDEESIHALVRHKSSGFPVGVVRLVLPSQKSPDRPLPIETHFGHSFEKQLLSRYDFTRGNIAEVSRFAVSKKSLQQVQHQLLSEYKRTNAGMEPNDPKKLLPHISLGLIAMLFAISREHGVEYWYAAMEPSLSRLLTRLGIRFTPIGPVMDYHGMRQPMIAKVSDLLLTIQRTRKDFYRLIGDIGGVPVSLQGRDSAHGRLVMNYT